MGRNELKEEWARLAPAWIKESREGRNPSRVGLLDKPMLAACGDVRGLEMLDCGCGEGRFCRILRQRGAKRVLGIDLCAPMIDAARQLENVSGSDNYRLADAQDLSFLADASFDVVVSYLNQCDLPDFQANNREVFRVLRPGGRFVVANLHPMRSAVGTWLKTNEGVKQHAILDRYFDEGERYWKMLNADFTNFHRTLSTYLRSYVAAGFAVVDIVEPTVDAESLQRFPELDDELRVPNFIIYVLKKV
ncbi:MAG TPA: class I SAM-dependent methyltransferase [Candidatus Angelobacter sp.]|nr:class I SAM-dependent methyltransferase [Candidatus Angelobacter sp.]